MTQSIQRTVIVGHVDDGKSTMMARLLQATGSISESKLAEVEKSCKSRGIDFEWAFLLDALQAERSQAVTIDSTELMLKTKEKNIILIDAPGHIEFLKNMVSAAARADSAILIIDAKKGIRRQTKIHSYLLYILGVMQITVVINKMDLINYSKTKFNQLSLEIKDYLHQVGIEPVEFIPLSAKFGDGIEKFSENLSWYKKPALLLHLLKLNKIAIEKHEPLRLPVQDIYKINNKRILVGNIEYGSINAGDTVLFSPSNKTATVTTIEKWPTTATSANQGEAVGLTLDEELFIERGEIISHEKNPPMLSNVFLVNLFWLSTIPLSIGKSYRLCLNSFEENVIVEKINKSIDMEDLSTAKADKIEINKSGEVVLYSERMIPLDEYISLPKSGRVVLKDKGEIVAGGMLSLTGFPDLRNQIISCQNNIVAVKHKVTQKDRIKRFGHKGAVIWLTGLSGAGKSTLALEVEKRLFSLGFSVYVLDGDNLRSGINADLSFSPDDRSENIRRVGEVAKLFADAGFICISALISPYKQDRARVRNSIGDKFHEVYIQADLKTCEARDPKGHYKKARAGKIKDFTGISAPYEAPVNPELTIDTTENNLNKCLNQLINYIGDVTKSSTKLLSS